MAWDLTQMGFEGTLGVGGWAGAGGGTMGMALETLGGVGWERTGGGCESTGVGWESIGGGLENTGGGWESTGGGTG